MPDSAWGDALQLLRVILDTPSNEGDQRGRAAIQGGVGGDRRRSDGDRGRGRVEGEPADPPRLAGEVRGGGARGPRRQVAPTGEQPAPDGGGDRGHSPRD